MTPGVHRSMPTSAGGVALSKLFPFASQSGGLAEARDTLKTKAYESACSAHHVLRCARAVGAPDRRYNLCTMCRLSIRGCSNKSSTQAHYTPTLWEGQRLFPESQLPGPRRHNRSLSFLFGTIQVIVHTMPQTWHLGDCAWLCSLREIGNKNRGPSYQRREQPHRRFHNQKPEDVKTEPRTDEHENHENEGADGSHAMEEFLPALRQEVLEHLFAIQGEERDDIKEQQEKIDEDELSEELIQRR